jgi:hypothetical protein
MDCCQGYEMYSLGLAKELVAQLLSLVTIQNDTYMTLRAIFPSVKLDRLASSMVEVAVNGREEQTFENDAILKMITAVGR